MVQESVLEEPSEEKGLTEQGEIRDIAGVNPQNKLLHLSTVNQNPQRPQNNGRGRGGRPFIRQTGENDPYDVSNL